MPSCSAPQAKSHFSMTLKLTHQAVVRDQTAPAVEEAADDTVGIHHLGLVRKGNQGDEGHICCLHQISRFFWLYRLL